MIQHTSYRGLNAGLAAVLLALGIAGCGGEERPSEIERAKAGKALLSQLSDGKATAQSFFPGPDGMLGMVARNEATGETFIGWLSPSGTHLLLGPMVDGQGENLTALYWQKALGEKAPEQGPVWEGVNHLTDRGQEPETESQQPTGHGKIDTARVVPMLKELTYVSDGTGSRELYAFIDVRCPYCRDAERELVKIRDQAGLKLHWVPVDALGGQSELLGAALLAINTPDAVSDLGHLAKAKVQQQHIDALRRNSGVMSSIFGQLATPSFLYKADDGYAYEVGTPDDYMVLAKSIKQ